MRKLGLWVGICLFSASCASRSPITLKTERTYLGKKIQASVQVTSWKGSFARNFKSCLLSRGISESEMATENLHGKITFRIEAQGKARKVTHFKVLLEKMEPSRVESFQQCGDNLISDFNEYLETQPGANYGLVTLTSSKGAEVEILFPFKAEEIQKKNGTTELKLTPIEVEEPDQK